MSEDFTTWPDSLFALLSRVADDGRVAAPEGEVWTDDEAGAVEGFAMDVLAHLGWLGEWKAGSTP